MQVIFEVKIYFYRLNHRRKKKFSYLFTRIKLWRIKKYSIYYGYFGSYGKFGIFSDTGISTGDHFKILNFEKKKSFSFTNENTLLNFCKNKFLIK